MTEIKCQPNDEELANVNMDSRRGSANNPEEEQLIKCEETVVVTVDQKDNDIKIKIKHSLLKKIAAASLYGISSFLITVINKSVLTTYQFPSIQILGLGQILASIFFLHIAKRFKIIDYPNFHREKTIKQIWPLPLIFIANLIFGLAGTKKISLPMFTTIRKFAILMTMIGEIILLGEMPSLDVQISVFLMLFGSVIASSNDLAFTLEGYILVLLSDVFTAANGVYMKQKLVSNTFGTYGLMYYNSLFVILPATALAWTMGEFELIKGFNRWNDIEFLVEFGLSCCMGFILSYSIILCTDVNSALTTTIVGCLKNVIITYLGMFIGGDYIFSVVNFIGLNISVIGSLLYTWVTFKV